RSATVLRKIGIEISFGREGHLRTRIIRITHLITSTLAEPEYRGAQPSAASAAPAPAHNNNPANGFASPNLRTVVTTEDYARPDPGPNGLANPLEFKAVTTADGADANSLPQSPPQRAPTPGWSGRL